MQCRRSILILAALMIATAINARQFQVGLIVSDHQFSYTLYFGVHPNGSDGYDPGLDIFAPPPPPPGSFDARFSWMGSDFFTDIREDAPAVHQFILRYSASAQNRIVLRWNSEPLKALGEFFIVDRFTGNLFGPVDMSQVDSLAVSDPVILDGLRILATPASPNSPPSAIDDRFVAEEDFPTYINPLGNDFDPEQDPITIVRLDTSQLAGRISESPLEEGFLYHPAPDFSGADHFYYVISDGVSGTDTGRVTIDVAPVNDPPRWRDVPDTLWLEPQQPAEINLWAWAYDPETPASELHFSVSVEPEALKWRLATQEGYLILYPTPEVAREPVKLFLNVRDDANLTDQAVIYVAVNSSRPSAADQARQKQRVTSVSNFPNPFNSSTTIRFSLSQSSRVAVELYNLVGERVNTIWQGELPAGPHQLRWEGRDDRGNSLASGVYLYRIVAERTVWQGRLVLLR